MGGDRYQDGSGEILSFFLIFGGIPLAIVLAFVALIVAIQM